ncbi:mannose-6-phosphate isomerase [Candidatus Berkelbacteria bacterium CG06_land_8_20_14_3_00_43_10]|nr:MAG: mannose-6-phosphate isomerase [Candidatus Berkelbacteria bacterium CG06_land_8_20_14_3_00_43_10]
MHDRKTFVLNKPWGKYEQFTFNEQSTVKILTVNAGVRLSYQSHNHREEFWKCIKNSVKVIIDDVEVILKDNEEIRLPKGCKHRLIGLEREGKVLEISFGAFDEEDIIRYEDDFGREGTTNTGGTS